MQRNLFSEAMQSRRGGGPTQDWSKEKKNYYKLNKKKVRGRQAEERRGRRARERGGGMPG